MGVVATLVDANGGQVRGLPDPAGGTFDAAGDFDRLLSEPVRQLRTLCDVDLYGSTAFTRVHMDDIVSDIEILETAGVSSIERRGLEATSRLGGELPGRARSVDHLPRRLRTRAIDRGGSTAGRGAPLRVPGVRYGPW